MSETTNTGSQATLHFAICAASWPSLLEEKGLAQRRGQRVAGIYRRSVVLAIGRCAMLDEGMDFSLVPWKPVIEQGLGQQLAATVRGDGLSWEIGRQPGSSIGWHAVPRTTASPSLPSRFRAPSADRCDHDFAHATACSR